MSHLEEHPKCREFAPASFFPDPITEKEALFLKVRVLVFKLRYGETDHVFVAQSADCAGCHGDGDTEEAALSTLTCNLECVVCERNGGLFSEMSSKEFQMEYFEKYVEGWKMDGISVVSVCESIITLFNRAVVPKSTI